MARKSIRTLNLEESQPFIQFLTNNPNSSFSLIHKNFPSFTRGQISDILSILIAHDEISIKTNKTRKNRIVYFVTEKKGGEN